MRTPADQRRIAGLFAAALVAQATTGCARYLPRDTTEASVRHELSRVAKWGHPARVIWRSAPALPPHLDPAETECPAQITCIVVTPRDFRVQPSPADQAILTPPVVAELRRTVIAPYQMIRDYDGALRSAARWYIDIVEHAEHRRLRPPPAPILSGDPLNGIPNAYNTAWLGVPLSLAIALLGLALEAGAIRARDRA